MSASAPAVDPPMVSRPPAASPGGPWTAWPGVAPARAVVFDLNGTLADDEPLLADIFCELLAAEGVTLGRDRYWRELAGLSDPEIAARGLSLRGREPEPEEVAHLVERKSALYRQRVAERSPLRPGAAELVRTLAARMPVAVVTGAPRAEVERVLAGAGLLALLSACVCAEDVQASKPDPEGYLRALEALAPIPAAEVIVIEDSLPGIDAARAAGMRCLAVRGTAPERELAARADGVLDGLSLHGVLEALHA